MQEGGNIIFMQKGKHNDQNYSHKQSRKMFKYVFLLQEIDNSLISFCFKCCNPDNED